MVELTYKLIHVPELCVCATHHQGFVCVEKKVEFGSFHTAVKTVAHWNSRDDCWCYVIKKAEWVDIPKL